MRIVMAMALAASLFVAAGCSCNTCEVPVEDCAPCAAAPAPAPVAVAPAVTCNPCAGL